MANISIHQADVREFQSLYWDWVQERSAKTGAGSVALPVMSGAMPDNLCTFPNVPDDFLPVLEAAGMEFTRH